jgi:hypothetical protein
MNRLSALRGTTALALLLPALAWAAPPSDKQVERLLEASRAQGMLDAVLPQMEALQRQQFQQFETDRGLTPAQQAEAARIQQRTTQIMRESLNWEQMRPLYIDAYQKTFTAQDVTALTKFYESAAGKSLLDKTPVLMQNLMLAMQQKVEPMLDALKTELDGVATEGARPAAEAD